MSLKPDSLRPKLIKRLLPAGLMGRTLLILVVPTILIQLVIAHIFLDRHWGNVTRHLANALAGEIGFLVDQLQSSPEEEHTEILRSYAQMTGSAAHIEQGKDMPSISSMQDFPEFLEALDRRLEVPFSAYLEPDEETIHVRVRLNSGMLDAQTTNKRLVSPTTSIFLLWMIAASVFFLLIAVLFLRNQIRPIHRLAKAAEAFGRGHDLPGFRPGGAREVRQAARSLLIMRERLKRQISTRTEMLAGISHDLRTPLTRMKLQLALMGKSPEIELLHQDIAQMEHMIQEYLEFARGEGGEATEHVSISELVREVAQGYARSGRAVEFTSSPDLWLNIRPNAFRRVLHNLVDNALSFGTRCTIGLEKAYGRIELTLDDDGSGIPEPLRAEALKPFRRLDAARNPQKGGAGLGLTIARDIVLAHGGDMLLLDAPQGGLRVLIRLPG